MGKKVSILLSQSETKYTGRLLGFVTEEEFRCIISSNGLVKKISTSESLSLRDLIKADARIKGNRLVFSINLEENKAQEKISNTVHYNTLLITDTIEDLTYSTMRTDSTEAGFSFSSNIEQWLIIEEPTKQD